MAIPSLMALAIDHRSQLEEMDGATPDKIEQFKRLAVKAAARVAGGRPGYGMLLDDKYGRLALFDANAEKLWVAKPLELPGSRPLRSAWAAERGLALSVPLIVKYRDAGTDARVALEEAIR